MRPISITVLSWLCIVFGEGIFEPREQRFNSESALTAGQLRRAPFFQRPSVTTCHLANLRPNAALDTHATDWRQLMTAH